MAIATLLPEGAGSESITWSSANAGIATVNNTGNITGKKQGIAEIRGISYIIKRTPVINYKKKTMSFKGEEIYEYVAGNKVSWRNDTNKKNGYSPQLEMEDVYIYNGKMYFNSEGGNDCIDLLGKSK